MHAAPLKTEESGEPSAAISLKTLLLGLKKKKKSINLQRYLRQENVFGLLLKQEVLDPNKKR